MVDLVEEKAPVAFISYSWDDEEHKQWVLALGTRLRADGINLVLDQWNAYLGDELTRFMETSIREADSVIIICTPAYRQKSDARKGGAGYEAKIITAQLFHEQKDRKFIPVLRRGEWLEAAASWISGKNYADLRGDPYPESNYRELVHTILGLLPQPAPIGSRQARDANWNKVSACIKRERVYADLIDSAERVCRAARTRYLLLRQLGPAAKRMREREVEPELRLQAARFMEYVNSLDSDEVEQAAKELLNLIVLWKNSVSESDGHSICEEQFNQFSTVGLARLREAVRRELASLRGFAT